MNRSHALAPAAVILPLIAVFVGLSAPRAVPLPRSIPRPHVSTRDLWAAEDAELARIERLRDSPALREADRRFGDWNEAESSPGDPSPALARFRSAFLALPRFDRLGFLAARAESFVSALARVRDAVARGREDREALRDMRALVGSRFEERAMKNGLVDADLPVLRGVFKLRIVTAVEPALVAAIPRVERLAFHRFVAAQARSQDLELRLRSIEEMGRLDRDYPAELAAAILLAAEGRHEDAADRLLSARRPSVRIRNHLLWLAARSGRPRRDPGGG